MKLSARQLFGLGGKSRKPFPVTACSFLLCLGTTLAGQAVEEVDFTALRLAIQDLSQTFGEKYPKGQEHLRRLEAFESRQPELRRRLEQGDPAAQREIAELLAFQRECLLANPLLDFDRLLVVKRQPLGDARRPKGNDYGLGEFLGLPRQSSWQQDTIPKLDGWTNEIAVLSALRQGGELKALFRPAKPKLAGDIELDFDAQHILFSMPDDQLL